MRTKSNVKFISFAAHTVVLIAVLCGCTVVTQAATNSFKTLFTFNGPDGLWPTGTLAADAQGNLYGTTNQGGAHNLGIVFELTPTAQGQWKEIILYSFAGGSDGVVPWTGVIFDSKGNIYGTTSGGGRYSNCMEGCGTVFQLTKGAGGTWTEQFFTHSPVRAMATFRTGWLSMRREIFTAQPSSEARRIVTMVVAALSSS